MSFFFAFQMADVAVDTECNDPKELFGQGKF